MSTMQSEVFEALRAIDIPEDKALKAATALSRRDDDVSALKRDMAVIKWMIGTLYPIVLGIFGTIFALWLKIGDLTVAVARAH